MEARNRVLSCHQSYFTLDSIKDAKFDRVSIDSLRNLIERLLVFEWLIVLPISIVKISRATNTQLILVRIDDSVIRSSSN